MSIMVGAFARDENGDVKTKQACQTKGCNWPNWHVCLVGKPDTFAALIAALPKKRKGPTAGRTLGPRTDIHRQNIAYAQQDRWLKTNGERDKKMVEYYKSNNVGYKDVAKKFDVSSSTAYKVLKKAEVRGEIKMRKRGLVLKYSS